MPEITPETLGQLIERHAGPLELYASQWTAAPGDVVQEAFLRLFQQRPAPANPVAWLYRTVRHRSLNDARGRRRRDRHERRAAELRPALVAPPDSMLGADEVAEALQSLDDEQREVLVARLWGELTFEQVAELTGSSTSTVYRRYQSALENLRSKVSSWIVNRSN